MCNVLLQNFIFFMPKYESASVDIEVETQCEVGMLPPMPMFVCRLLKAFGLSSMSSTTTYHLQTSVVPLHLAIHEMVFQLFSPATYTKNFVCVHHTALRVVFCNIPATFTMDYFIYISHAYQSLLGQISVPVFGHTSFKDMDYFFRNKQFCSLI